MMKMTEASKQRAKVYAESCDNESGGFLTHQLEKIREKAYLKGMQDPDAVGLLEENKRLREQIEFTKEYLNPADTSFRKMVHDFKSLSKNDQMKLIQLSPALKALSSGVE